MSSSPDSSSDDDDTTRAYYSSLRQMDRALNEAMRKQCRRVRTSGQLDPEAMRQTCKALNAAKQRAVAAMYNAVGSDEELPECEGDVQLATMAQDMINAMDYPLE